MNKSLVSVVVAVKNGERFLAAAINSVLEQDYEPLEIIVVDGQSVDGTGTIAKSFKEVRYIRQVDQGVADAWNVGIDASGGEFIAFLSHDDLWTPDKLSVQVNHLVDHPETQYNIAKVKFFLERGCSIPPGLRKGLLEGEYVGRIMETLVSRRSAFDIVGNFDTGLSVSEDADWFARAKDKNVPMAVMPEVLLHKRVHDANLSLSAVQETQQNLLRVLRQSIVRQRRHKPRAYNSRNCIK